MYETIIVFVVFGFVSIFLIDLRRKIVKQRLLVQNVKDEITRASNMAAAVGSFRDSVGNETILGLWEEKRIFFYRLVSRGRVLLQYNLKLANISSFAIYINNILKVFEGGSEHAVPSLRAKENTSYICDNIPNEEIEKIRSMALQIVFKTEKGLDKTIPIPVFKAKGDKQPPNLAKTLENVVWWQQYVMSMISKPNTKNIIHDSGFTLPDGNF